MKISDLWANGRYLDFYKLLRFFYRIGNPLVDDFKYEDIESSLMENGIIPEEIYDRTYDDDPVPFDLLKELDLMEYVPEDLGSNSEYITYLDEQKSLSIRPVTTFSEAYDFFMHHKNDDLILSKKIDGVNSKHLLIKGNLELSMTRGRSGNGFDITRNVRKCIVNSIDQFKDFDSLKLVSESYVQNDALPYLRNKYLKPYKNAKSSALSMLRVNHDSSDYRYLHSIFFSSPDLGEDTVENCINKLNSLGFETVPYIMVKAGSFPTKYDEFVSWLKDKCKEMWYSREDLPSDGMVVEVNNYSKVGDVVGKYSSRNIALKLEYWSSKVYKGVIEDIVVEQRRVFCCCKVRIKPIMTNGCEARIINTFNPSILFENNLGIDSEVYFERNSDAINIALHGDKLKRLDL